MSLNNRDKVSLVKGHAKRDYESRQAYAPLHENLDRCLGDQIATVDNLVDQLCNGVKCLKKVQHDSEFQGQRECHIILLHVLQENQ